MIDRIIGNKLIPASTRQDIIERTDGIPLFVEEMTKVVLEAMDAKRTFRGSTWTCKSFRQMMKGAQVSKMTTRSRE